VTRKLSGVFVPFFVHFDYIIDVRVTDTDAKTISQRPRQGLGSSRKKEKRILGPCLEQRHFTPFVVSTDSLIGKENLAEEAIHPIG
jgi:hypothetical protein